MPETEKRVDLLTLDPHEAAPEETVSEAQENPDGEIIRAQKNNTILTAKVASVETHNTENGPVSVVTAIYKGAPILVPVSEMNTRVKEGLTPKEEESERIRYCQRMAGSEINLIVTHVDVDEKSRRLNHAVGSRKQAMDILQKAFFFDKDESGLPKVHEGIAMEMRITAISAKTFTLEGFGFETRVPAIDVEDVWMPDVRQSEKYYIGKIVRVKVVEVKTEEPGKISVRFAPYKNVKQYPCVPKSVYTGTVTHVTKNGTLFVYLDLGKKVIAHLNNKMSLPILPKEGSVVSVFYTGDSEKTGLGMGSIQQVIRLA